MEGIAWKNCFGKKKYCFGKNFLWKKMFWKKIALERKNIALET